MSALSVQSMTGLLTQPYRRGAETLEVPLGPDAAGVTPIPAYTFKEYRARHGAEPSDPRYVLYLKTPAPADGLSVAVTYSVGGVDKTATVAIPGGAFAFTSFAIPIDEPANPALRLVRFRQSPVALAGAGSANFGIVALLGNIAKLAWVLGWEKDQIRRQQEDVRRQRHVRFAHDASLDAIGADLRVFRFPARPYTFDRDTVALYHLDEIIASNGPVADDTARFGLPGHPGVNDGALSGASGKFGSGFRVPGADSAAAGFTIAASADFDLPANQSFTVELFARVDPQAGPSLVVGRGTVDAAGALNAAGWTLMAGTFRGISNNVRWAGSDGANTFEVFADRDLGDRQLHHLAGIVDRSTERPVLAVDGVRRIGGPIDTVGALTSAEPIRVGKSAAGHQFSGVVDELRLSKIARTEFAPVLGEGDASYRRRLGIFRRWLLPNPAELLRTINGLVQIDGNPSSFVLIEKNRTAAATTAAVRVIPAAIASGQRIAADGNTLVDESSIEGMTLPEPEFRTFYLLRHDNAAASYLGGEDGRRMQTGTARALDALLALLAAANPAIPGRLQIVTAFSPSAADARSVGRGLTLRHETLALDALAVFAHRAAFDFVRNDGAEIYVSVVAGEQLEFAIEARPAAEVPVDGSDLFVGNGLNVTVAQTSLPASGTFRWTLVPCGAGRATLLPHPGDPAALKVPVEGRPRLRLRADAPGEISLRVEHTVERRTVTGTRTFRITVAALADTETIASNGSRTRTEADAVGAPDAPFNPDYLITSTLGIVFGADPNNRRMQLALEKPLVRLTTLLPLAGFAANTLAVLKSFDPAGAPLHTVGRAVRLQHPAANADALAALAHQAGFGFVRREAAVVYASVSPGPLVEIARADGSPLPVELTLSAPVDLRARFTALPAAGAYNWSTDAVGLGAGRFDFVLRPQVRFTPTAAGAVALNLTYLQPDAGAVEPYTVDVRLAPALDVPATIILKEQYDLLMNILNYFHPVGVEVLTRSIREHVVEVRQNLLDAFPGYTYPDFRM